LPLEKQLVGEGILLGEVNWWSSVLYELPKLLSTSSSEKAISRSGRWGSSVSQYTIIVSPIDVL
jgi:hypothetical protein